jgi:hypothetical protein
MMRPRRPKTLWPNRRLFYEIAIRPRFAGLRQVERGFIVNLGVVDEFGPDWLAKVAG